MIFAKFQTPVLGQFWLEVDLRDNLQAEQFAKGIQLGWSLGRQEPLELVDIRLSKHPTEPTRSVETLQEFLQTKES